jgi:hypothetical protein
MQRQLQTNWCWSAVSTSIALFFNPQAPWTQCSLARAELAQTTNSADCCTAPSNSGVCNEPWYLHTALRRVGHFDRSTAAAATFTEVSTEIGARRPICVRFEWAGGGGAAHFFVVEGFMNDPAHTLQTDDSIYGQTVITHADLKTSYRGAASGQWTHSYWTRR